MRQAFQIDFDLGNEAFDSPDKRRAEVARLVREIAGKVENGSAGGFVFDVNGNRIGTFDLDTVVEAEEEEEFEEEEEEERETPLDTPSLDTSFHDREMDV